MASRILIINTNRELAPQPTVPIGAAWVAEALSLAGFTVKFLDLCFAKSALTPIERVLREFRPDGIGISVRNLDNCDFLSPRSFLPELKQVTDFIKRRTDARILLGGAGVSIMPTQVLEYLDLDWAVVGAGERAAVDFFRGDGKNDPARLAGVIGRQRGDTPPSCASPSSPDTLPGRALPAYAYGADFPVMPQMHNWVNLPDYLRYEPVLPVQGKRGCTNRCLYCTYNKIEGTSWRLREPASVVEEISLSMAITGAREFEFVDSVFNQPEGYLEVLLEEILRRGLKAKFRVASLAPRGLTKAQVKLMERSGMASLVITPETVSDATLAALGKDFTEDDINRTAELISGSSIKALWCFLLGGPREDEATLAQTIGFINRRIGNKDAAFITTGIRIYPGTGLHQVAIDEGITHPEDSLLFPRFYFTPRITPQKARETLQNGLTDSSRCIFLSDTQQDSLSTWRRIGTILRLSNPFWHYAGYMNKLSGKNRVIGRTWSPSPRVGR